jgi:ATP-dependent exoDNAse (exonuclease V) beta subunit
LLFQTGYLTIKGYNRDTQLYRLSYPNYEVEHAFLHYLLEAFSQVWDDLNGSYLQRLAAALRTGDLNAFFEALKIFLARIPYDLQIRQEKYYQTIFYLLFALLNLRIDVEKRTQRGRIDTVLELPDRIYLFEFKLDGSAQAALDQINEKGYAEGYRNLGKTLHLVGVNFDSKQRNVGEWLSVESPAIKP